MRAKLGFMLLVGIVTTACHWLEDPIETKPVASLSAVEGADATPLKVGEVRTLAVQALDDGGKPINGASIVFVRGEPHAFDFETVEPATASLVVTTENRKAAGLQADGLAIARVRVAASTEAREGDIFGFATSSAGVDAAAVGLVVRFHLTIAADAGSSDAAADAGGDQ